MREIEVDKECEMEEKDRGREKQYERARDGRKKNRVVERKNEMDGRERI